jgi:hypothetical protein
MELLSSKFKNSIKDILRKISSENFILFATIPTAQNRLLDVVDQLRNHPNSVIFTVNK